MKIEFIPSSEEVEMYVDKPEPAKNFIPDWYKKIDSFYLKEPEFNEKNGEVTNKNIKMCMPFFDAYNLGYIQKTWTDIYIEKKEGKLSYYYSYGPEPIEIRGESQINTDWEVDNVDFVWKEPWIPKTPKGYSTLYLSPLNHFNLSTFTISGVIETDKYHHTPFGRNPFFLNKNFSGLIPKGTPMYQMIPFKRDKWDSYFLNFDTDKTKKNMAKINSLFWGSYKKYFHEKKYFN